MIETYCLDKDGGFKANDCLCADESGHTGEITDKGRGFCKSGTVPIPIESTMWLYSNRNKYCPFYCYSCIDGPPECVGRNCPSPCHSCPTPCYHHSFVPNTCCHCSCPSPCACPCKPSNSCYTNSNSCSPY